MENGKWDESNIGDQSGRVAIVTGSSSGIGFETARVLAEKNADVIIAVRNAEKGEKALERIQKIKPDAKVRVMILDLADLDSVKNFADEFRSNYGRLDLLINNAGVMMPPYSKTKDGFELQFGTNHLGHYALSGQLLDILKNTPDSRIVNVSSNLHKSGNIDFDDVNWEKRKYSKLKAYSDSKIANIYFTNGLVKRMNGKGPLIVSAHPGWTETDLQRHAESFNFLNRFFAQKPIMGALPTLYAALGNDAKSGDYFGPAGFMEMRGYPKLSETSKLAKDSQAAEKLWELSENLTGVIYNLN